MRIRPATPEEITAAGFDPQLRDGRGPCQVVEMGWPGWRIRVVIRGDFALLGTPHDVGDVGVDDWAKRTADAWNRRWATGHQDCRSCDWDWRHGDSRKVSVSCIHCGALSGHPTGTCAAPFRAGKPCELSVLDA